MKHELYNDRVKTRIYTIYKDVGEWEKVYVQFEAVLQISIQKGNKT